MTPLERYCHTYEKSKTDDHFLKPMRLVYHYCEELKEFVSGYVYKEIKDDCWILALDAEETFIICCPGCGLKLERDHEKLEKMAVPV